MAIQAELNVPDTVTLPTRGYKVHVDVLCRLHNTGDDAHVVGSSSPDTMHNWHVLSETNREVLAAPRGGGKKAPAGKLPTVTKLIEAGHSYSAPQKLTLDARKLTAGKRYTVRYEHHGHTAEAAFTVVAGHTAPAKKRAAKKPAAKKPAAKKAPAKKKPAARKRTAKKGAAKK